MTKGEPIIIERVANGWIVRPAPRLDQDRIPAPRDSYHVFQHLQYDAQGVGVSEGSVFGWLLKHFREEAS